MDWSIEPAVLISSDNPYFHPRPPTEDDYDCKTLLDYLGQSTTNLDISLPLQILSTEQDTSDSDCPQITEDIKECPSGGERKPHPYNVSVESGVVLDSDPHIAARKSSDGSSHLSHGSSHVHSYVGVGDGEVCACSECREQRERLYAIKYNRGGMAVDKDKMKSTHSVGEEVTDARVTKSSHGVTAADEATKSSHGEAALSKEEMNCSDMGIAVDKEASTSGQPEESLQTSSVTDLKLGDSSPAPARAQDRSELTKCYENDKRELSPSNDTATDNNT